MLNRRKRIFYPGDPVPPELFVGRNDEIEILMEHGVAQAMDGHPKAMFILGEYGMGKSSIATYVKSLAENDGAVYGIYASLGGATTIQELTRSVLSAIEDTPIYQTSSERNGTLAEETDEERSLLTTDMFAVRSEQARPSPDDADEALVLSGRASMALLSYLKKLRQRLFTGSSRPILLILDEIDTLAPNRLFAPFVKGFIDTNAQDRNRVPLLLLVCGVRRCWQQMVEAHESIERVFEPIEIPPMSLPEALDFYRQAFAAASIGISEGAIREFHYQSAGIPRLMHLIGETAYRAHKNHRITIAEARVASAAAAQNYGNRIVREKLAPILHTGDERSILYQLGRLDRQRPTFQIGEVAGGLSGAELPKLHGFLNDLIRIGVLRPGETRDQFEFCVPLVQHYFSLVERKKLRL